MLGHIVGQDQSDRADKEQAFAHDATSPNLSADYKASLGPTAAIIVSTFDTRKPTPPGDDRAHELPSRPCPGLPTSKPATNACTGPAGRSEKSARRRHGSSPGRMARTQSSQRPRLGTPHAGSLPSTHGSRTARFLQKGLTVKPFSAHQ